MSESEETKKITGSIESEVDYFEKSEPIKSAVTEGRLVELRSEQEKTRAWLTKALVIIFGSTISGFFLFIVIGIAFPNAVNKEDLKDLLTLILTSETGIIGTALGFYFGNQSKS